VRDVLAAGIRRLRKEWADHLSAENADYNARLDAELLLAYALHTARVDLYARSSRVPTDGELENFEALLTRRSGFEPIAYIIGEREFYGLSFAVGPGVLIPRPETELIIDTARELAGTPRRIIDIGTGSGALAICLARVFPEADVWATELSPDAFAWAERNAERLLNADERARCAFVPGDLIAGVAGRFDLIVSNPPYLGEAEYRACMPDVRLHEPAAALLADENGLALYRRLIGVLPATLAPRGMAIFEISENVAEGVRQLARETGLSCEFRKDLAGQTRLALVHG